jgi:hypothetical protein
MAMRKFQVAAGALVLFTIGLIVFVLLKRDSTHDISAAEVASITVTMDNRPDGGGDEKFIAATIDHGRLLALIQGGTIDPNPQKWQGLGVMDIALAKGEKIPISLFWTAEGPAAWRIGNTYYRGSTDAEMIRVISECARRGTSVGR